MLPGQGYFTRQGAMVHEYAVRIREIQEWNLEPQTDYCDWGSILFPQPP
jgi:hypothetical protein